MGLVADDAWGDQLQFHQYDPLEVPTCVHTRVSEQARTTPNAVAVLSKTERLSYAEFDRRSSLFAHALIALGIGHGSAVAVCAERTPGLLVALLGILKAGAAYVPIAPNYPTARIDFILGDVEAALLVTDSASQAVLPPGRPRLLLDEQPWAAGESATDWDLVDGVTPGSRAYVMYTSGSTGTPKGVAVPHRAIQRLTDNTNCVVLGPGTVFLHAAPIAFDASTIEVWGPLCSGGAVALFQEPVPTPAALRACIAEFGVKVAWLTASLFNLIVDQDPSCLAGLTHLLTGGEALSIEHVRRASLALPHVQLVNGYGPTECTTFATCFPIPRPVPSDWTAIPIGTAIHQTTLYVVTAAGAPAAPGEIGELLIGGDGLALEYVNQPDLTARSFIADPVFPGRRVYRTGDLVRLAPEGWVEYVGRVDRQVKIRGFRIELGEIEAAVMQLPDIQAAALTVNTTALGEKRLIAYFVPRPNRRGAVTGAALAAALAPQLPDYMVPHLFVALDELPLTDNGKLDHRALPAPSTARPEQQTNYRAPTTPRERDLCEIWQSLLELEPIGVDDNFFELGGSSLLAVRAAARIEKDCAVVLPVVRFFELPTVAGLAAYLNGASNTTALNSRLERSQRIGSPGADGRIAIIGMSGRFPGSASTEELWRSLVEGREGISFFAEGALDPTVPSQLSQEPNYVRARGILADYDKFDAAFFGVSPAEARLMDPQQRVLLELSWATLEDGGYVPDGTADVIGIFAGKYNDSYNSELVARAPAAVERFGTFNSMLASEKDYVATRVAHALDLTGPALSIHTACSTSLVCIAQAVLALRAGQCDLALAGAAAITVPVESGYLHQEGAMLSPDGHTRTFSDQAGGTVFSDGAAMVLLKRLDEAVAARDHIYAVISGAAVNNDGRHKASFTAPSVDAQALVVALAQRDAGVTAEQIDYVEAHGTATRLGDPVELEALGKAFGLSTDRKQYCAIGSLKSNLGHTVTAAGAAGVIKTALAFERELIPKTLHFERPNPAIDFAASPFFVVTENRAWPRGPRPRRAGVSSFGVGGTNAHVVLEEAPVVQRAAAPLGAELLCLSARTPGALERASQALGVFLADHPDLPLRDVAYTLHQGRAAFSQRRFLVATDTGTAARELTGEAAAPSAAATRLPRPVFLFPGQGSQFHGMGAVLYARYAEFRAHFDLCDSLLEPLLGFRLRQALFEGDEAAGNEALRDTSLTQPALFAVEYALARLLLSFGIEPFATVGHSVGEFVAATLAGVMSLADALLLVARRGALMQAQESGGMLSVRQSAAEISPLLPPELCIASHNAPSLCVVAGPQGALAALQASLESTGVACRILVTSHAFHSPMMEPVVAPFRELVASVQLSAPQTRFVSTATGTWITDEQATDPDYWAKHLRRPVLFSQALQTLLAEENVVFVEVGPRNVLTTLLFQHRSSVRPSGFATLGSNDATSEAALLSALGRLWEAGFALDQTIHGDPAAARRVPLPTYSFERDRHWIEVESPSVADGRAQASGEAASAVRMRVDTRTLLENQQLLMQRQLELLRRSRG